MLTLIGATLVTPPLINANLFGNIDIQLTNDTDEPITQGYLRLSEQSLRAQRSLDPSFRGSHKWGKNLIMPPLSPGVRMAIRPPLFLECDLKVVLESGVAGEWTFDLMRVARIMIKDRDQWTYDLKRLDSKHMTKDRTHWTGDTSALNAFPNVITFYNNTGASIKTAYVQRGSVAKATDNTVSPELAQDMLASPTDYIVKKEFETNKGWDIAFPKPDTGYWDVFVPGIVLQNDVSLVWESFNRDQIDYINFRVNNEGSITAGA